MSTLLTVAIHLSREQDCTRSMQLSNISFLRLGYGSMGEDIDLLICSEHTGSVIRHTIMYDVQYMYHLKRRMYSEYSSTGSSPRVVACPIHSVGICVLVILRSICYYQYPARFAALALSDLVNSPSFSSEPLSFMSTRYPSRPR